MLYRINPRWIRQIWRTCSMRRPTSDSISYFNIYTCIHTVVMAIGWPLQHTQIRAHIYIQNLSIYRVNPRWIRQIWRTCSMRRPTSDSISYFNIYTCIHTVVMAIGWPLQHTQIRAHIYIQNHSIYRVNPRWIRQIWRTCSMRRLTSDSISYFNIYTCIHTVVMAIGWPLQHTQIRAHIYIQIHTIYRVNPRWIRQIWRTCSMRRLTSDSRSSFSIVASLASAFARPSASVLDQKKGSTGHTHTHTPTENNTPATSTHTHDKNNTQTPHEHLPQTPNNARRWRDDGACHLPRRRRHSRVGYEQALVCLSIRQTQEVRSLSWPAWPRPSRAPRLRSWTKKEHEVGPGLYKISLHLILCVQESIIPLLHPPICITHTSAILLRDFVQYMTPLPDWNLYAIHHTVLVMTISCKG